jgi:hypothetical protein
MDLKLTCGSCGQHIVVDSCAGGSTVACPSCSTPLPVPEIVNHSGPPQKQRSIGCLLPGVVIIAALGIVAYLITLQSPTETNRQHQATQHKTTYDEAGDAYFAAKLFCEKCEPTATNFTCEPELPEYNNKGRWCSNMNPPRWSVMGYVDCQKRHGASKSNLRQLWVVELVHIGHSWHITWLDIAGEKLYQSD